jgi:2,3-bisphosphoglycerate-dependent phosphoglycerate mutase
MSTVNVCPVDPSGSATPSRRLWLVRHGESTWNATGLVQGHLDPGLTSAGREEAARCASLLAAERRPGALYSSDLRRALETASVIGEALRTPIEVDPALRERSLGDAEGGSSRDLGRDRSGITGGRVVDADAAPIGGESLRQLYERAARCAQRILSLHAGDVVVVCHGGVVRVLLAWLDGVGPDDMRWPEIDNAVPIARSLTLVPTCV